MSGADQRATAVVTVHAKGTSPEIALLDDELGSSALVEHSSTTPKVRSKSESAANTSGSLMLPPHPYRPQVPEKGTSWSG